MCTSDESAVPKASAAHVRRMFKKYGASATCGWLSFKYCLKKELGIPAEQKWDVPPEWQQAYKRACGRE